jgi:hypothetical protein
VNKQTLDSFIIGSRIALAMSTAKGSPVRSSFARAVKSGAKENSNSSQLTKKRNQRLSPGVNARDRQLAKEIARMDKLLSLMTKQS